MGPVVRCFCLVNFYFILVPDTSSGSSEEVGRQTSVSWVKFLTAYFICMDIWSVGPCRIHLLELLHFWRDFLAGPSFAPVPATCVISEPEPIS